MGLKRVVCQVVLPQAAIAEDAFDPPQHRIVEAFMTYPISQLQVKRFKTHLKRGKTSDVEAECVNRLCSVLQEVIKSGNLGVIGASYAELDAKLQSFKSEHSRAAILERAGRILATSVEAFALFIHMTWLDTMKTYLEDPKKYGHAEGFKAGIADFRALLHIATFTPLLQSCDWIPSALEIDSAIRYLTNWLDIEPLIADIDKKIAGRPCEPIADISVQASVRLIV